MNVERVTAILVLTCFLGALIVLPLKFLNDRGSGGALSVRVGQLTARLERSNGAPASASGSDVLPTASELLSLYQGLPRAIKEGRRAFVDAQELNSFAARAGATGEFRRMISPPLELSAAAAAGVVNLVCISNPRNDALRQKITTDPL